MEGGGGVWCCTLEKPALMLVWLARIPDFINLAQSKVRMGGRGGGDVPCKRRRTLWLERGGVRP